jgi:hypothetical protein
MAIPSTGETNGISSIDHPTKVDSNNGSNFAEHLTNGSVEDHTNGIAHPEPPTNGNLNGNLNGSRAAEHLTNGSIDNQAIGHVYLANGGQGPPEPIAIVVCGYSTPKKSIVDSRAPELLPRH